MNMVTTGFCDLNISIPPQHLNPSCLDRLASSGYKTIAVNTVIEEEFDAITGTKKKKGKANEAIPAPKVSFSKESQDRKIKLLQRLTVYFSDASQLQKLCKSDNAKKYDILSVVPKSFTAFQLACACKDVDLISFDASEKPIMMNRKSYNLAVSNGIFFEVPYAPAISDSGKRKNTIQIAHLYHIYGKSKNLIITSGATNIIKIRSPYDVVNLVLHQNLNLPVSAHASEHKINKLEECYNLKGIYKQEEHPDPDINDAKLKNVETALQLILKSKIPDGLNIRGLLFGLSEEQAKYSMSNMSRALIHRAEGRRFGKTAMTLMITDLQLESEDESEDSEPIAKRSKPTTDSDSETSNTL